MHLIYTTHFIPGEGWTICHIQKLCLNLFSPRLHSRGWTTEFFWAWPFSIIIITMPSTLSSPQSIVPRGSFGIFSYTRHINMQWRRPFPSFAKASLKSPLKSLATEHMFGLSSCCFLFWVQLLFLSVPQAFSLMGYSYSKNCFALVIDVPWSNGVSCQILKGEIIPVLRS